MRTIAIPQLYCGASGKKGAYNRQEVGLARAFAALGCRAVVLYPDPDAAPEAVTSEDLEPNVRIYYVPARKCTVDTPFHGGLGRGALTPRRPEGWPPYKSGFHNLYYKQYIASVASFLFTLSR